MASAKPKFLPSSFQYDGFFIIIDAIPIIKRLIKDIEYRLKDKNLHLNITNTAKEYIINSSYDEKYGARPIKRFVQKNIETLIASSIINDQIKYGSTITIDLIDNKLVIK